MTTSIIDYIFRELAVSYLSRYDLAHVSEDEDDAKIPSVKNIVKSIDDDHFEGVNDYEERLIDFDKESFNSYNFSLSSNAIAQNPQSADPGVDLQRKVKQAKEKGFTGDICPDCHNMTMVRNGVCLKCMTCGATTSCS
jgi:ribonucleoside-diphosphate reductase alpha chain